MTNGRAERGSLLHDVAYGVRHGVFDDDLGQSLLRAWQVGACDVQLERMIRGRVHVLRVREAFGRLDPFVRPRLREGELVLGLATGGQEVRIPLQWLTTGLLVAGNTGSGKTNLLTWMVPAILASGCRVWATDLYKHTLRHLRAVGDAFGSEIVVLRACEWRVNLLQPWTGSPHEDLATVVDLLVRVLGLPPRSRTIALQGGHALFERFGVWEGRRDAYPTLYDLYEWTWSRPDLNAPAREALLDRLGTFLAALTPSCGAYRLGWNPLDLAGYSIVHELAGAPPHVAHVLLESALYAVMRHEVVHAVPNARIRLFLALDDGQRYLDGQPQSGDIQPLDELAGIIRGQGLGLGVFLQTTSGVSDRLMANLAVKLFGRLGLHTDWARLSAELGLNAEQLDWARRHTRPGVFIGQVAEGWREPFIFSAPRVVLPPAVTDADIDESMRPLRQLRTVRADEFTSWKPSHLRMPTVVRGQAGAGDAEPVDPHPQSAQPTVRAAGLTKEELDYLASVAAEPLQACTERDRDLGIGASKGSRIRGHLVQLGLLELVAVNPGGRGRRFQLLEFTDEGRSLLKDLGVPSPRGHGRGGIAHQWWCRTIGDWLTAFKIPVSIEDDASGARVDLVAIVAGGDQVAVEVELTPGHELENIRKDIAAGFQTVVSLLKDQAGVRRVQARLDSGQGLGNEVVTVLGLVADYPSVLGKVIPTTS